MYGVRLRCEDIQDIVPFYVLPPAAAAAAPIVFLAPTFTYQVYGNHRRGNIDDAFRARQAAWGAYPWNAEQHAEYGASTYNTHPDGSGICYSSLRRPLLTMRPCYITYFDDRGSGLRHFPAETHLIDWLTIKGITFDVITSGTQKALAFGLHPVMAALLGMPTGIGSGITRDVPIGKIKARRGAELVSA